MEKWNSSLLIFYLSLPLQQMPALKKFHSQICTNQERVHSLKNEVKSQQAAMAGNYFTFKVPLFQCLQNCLFQYNGALKLLKASSHLPTIQSKVKVNQDIISDLGSQPNFIRISHSQFNNNQYNIFILIGLVLIQ